jgi:UDP-N-acetyl-D-glucosamine dehydrogenase
MSSVPLSEELLKSHDLTLITTDHTSVDYQWIVNHAPIVVDTRNATKKVTTGKEKIVRA